MKRAIPISAIFCFSVLTASLSADDFGSLVFVGDSITQGGPAGSTSYKAPGYRYELWKHLVDSPSNTITLVGSQNGGFTGGGTPLSISPYKAQVFSNIHEGHYGWRASWANGTVALPAGRYNVNNLGQGTIANWTGQSTTFNTADAGSLTYTGSTYLPDTVCIMIGINDLADGASAGTVESRIQTMVQQFQAANTNAKIHVFSTLPVSSSHGSFASIDPKVSALNQSLGINVSGWSTGTSTVVFNDVRSGFNATTMTYDNVHPNYLGEKIIARNIANAIGIGSRDNTVGLNTRSSNDFTGEKNEMNSLPSTTSGALIYRAGTVSNFTDPVPGDSLITLNSPTNQASFLQSNWNIATQSAYSLEVRMQMVSNGSADNNCVIWSDDGTAGAAAGFLRVFGDRVEWGFSTSNRHLLDLNSNLDSQHTFRVSYDGSTYSVWRDELLIGDNLLGDSSVTASNRIVIGDFSSSGISTHATLDYVRIETGSAYAAVPEPSGSLLVGLSAAMFVASRRRNRLS